MLDVAHDRGQSRHPHTGEPGPHPRTRIDEGELLGGEADDGALAVRRPVEVGVMDDHRHPVGTRRRVDLDEVDAERSRGIDGREAVLRGHCRIAAVGDDERPGSRPGTLGDAPRAQELEKAHASTLIPCPDESAQPLRRTLRRSRIVDDYV